MLGRVGVCAVMTLAVGGLQACGSSSHATKANGSTATGPSANVPAAGFPPDLRLDPERVFLAFVDMQYGDRSCLALVPRFQ